MRFVVSVAIVTCSVLAVGQCLADDAKTVVPPADA